MKETFECPICKQQADVWKLHICQPQVPVADGSASTTGCLGARASRKAGVVNSGVASAKSGSDAAKLEAIFYRGILQQIASDMRNTRGKRLAESALMFWDTQVDESMTIHKSKASDAGPRGQRAGRGNDKLTDLRGTGGGAERKHGN